MPKYVVTEAQALAMKVMRDHARMSYAQIGRMFGISGPTVSFNISERRTRKYRSPHPFSPKETAAMLRSVADRLDPPPPFPACPASPQLEFSYPQNENQGILT
jgi:predicted transcriptional regulator